MSDISFTIAELLQELPGRNKKIDREMLDVDFTVREIAFDSRRINHPESALFIALKGHNRDGHAFVQQAYDRGVRCFLVEKPVDLPADAKVIQVRKTRKSLQKFARRYRERFSYPVIGITGSNGKTIVKEWLATLLESDFRLVKSPQSYNSQIGVPLSLLRLKPDLNLAIIEAGISEPGEMIQLSRLIQPQYGIMTHFGDAHAEGFASPEEKLLEKRILFLNCDCVFVSADAAEVCQALRAEDIPLQTVGFSTDADLQVLAAETRPGGWDITLQPQNAETQSVFLPVSGKAALENALLAILTARHFDVTWDKLRERLAALHPVSMRMELITDNPEIAIINDAYNADQASVENAFAMLEGERVHPGRAIVLSDMEHLGPDQGPVQKQLLDTARQKFGAENMTLIGPVFCQLAEEYPKVRAYLDIEAFLAAFDYARFSNKTVLLKGARRYALERVIPYLSLRVTATLFKINMNHLVHNYQQFRAWLSPQVKMMAMVKAFAYGSGTWEIAQTLEQTGIDYLAVAYTAEGIALRTRGIQVPIVIMNADAQNMEQLLRYQLEPHVYSIDFLREHVAAGQRQGFSIFPVHIKVDTGMRRLGFGLEDLAELNAFLAAHPQVEVRSVLSHLASADEPEMDAYTEKQVTDFAAFRDGLVVKETQAPLYHILNTAGIVRFPQYAMDMVRLGIGLYGISPAEGLELDLREVGSLHSVITQVHHYPAGTAIGYGCSEVTERVSLIATVPIGYADGIRRSLSNGVGRFLVRGQRVPVIGRVCMDMLMLDVTDIEGAKTGDEVTLIGCQGKACISVTEIAESCDTIPYEILTGISQRVRRVYVKE